MAKECTCGNAIGHPLMPTCICKPEEKREWRGLTKTEVKVLLRASNNKAEFAELIEAKLKQKNYD